jgi:hypothetical protein
MLRLAGAHAKLPRVEAATKPHATAHGIVTEDVAGDRDIASRGSEVDSLCLDAASVVQNYAFLNSIPLNESEPEPAIATSPVNFKSVEISHTPSSRPESQLNPATRVA